MSNNKNNKPTENAAASAQNKTEETKKDDLVMKQLLEAFKETNKKLEALQSEKEKDQKEREALREEIKKLKSKPAGADNHDEQIIDDYMDTPAVFFCYSSNFSLPSYKLRGKTVKAPDGNIRFKLLHRYKLGDGAQAKIHAVSAVKVHSLKERDYLRNFPGFGYKIHEKDEGPSRIDTQLADFLTKEAQRVNNMTDHAMIQACQTENISMAMDDISSMRRQLITKRAEMAMANYTKGRKAEEEKAVRMAVNATNIHSGIAPAHYDKTVIPEVTM